MPLAAPVTAARRAVVVLAEVVLIDGPSGAGVLPRSLVVIAASREGRASRPTSAARGIFFLRAQFQLSILTSCGCGAPLPLSTSVFRLIRNTAHFVLQ